MLEIYTYAVNYYETPTDKFQNQTTAKPCKHDNPSKSTTPVKKVL